MEPQAAIDSFKNVYVREYRNSVADLYKEDVKNGTSKDELPSWYNYEYSLTTQFKDGKEGVLNYTAVTFEYSGRSTSQPMGKTWLTLTRIPVND